MKRFALALLAALFATAAYAQSGGTVSNHAVAVGKGPGVTGLGSIAPGTTARPLVSNGASADPSFQLLTNAGLANMSASSFKCNGNAFPAQPQDCGLASIFPPASVVGSLMLYAGGSTWVAFNGNTSGTAFFTENSSGAGSWSPVGTGVITALGVNTGTAGAFVVNGGPGGTPSSLVLTNATGLPISTGVTGLGTGVITALGVNTGTAGAFVVNGGAGGTPSSLVLTNATGLPISTGVTGLGTGVATALGINVGSAGAFVTNNGTVTLTNKTISGASNTLTNIGNSSLTNSATTVAGQTCTLGSTCGLANATNRLAANVNLNNTASYFDGPSMAQGSTGTWFVSGTVTLSDTVAAIFQCKLWDGTTVLSNSITAVTGSGLGTISLSGIITSPAANMRISCRDQTTVNGQITATVGDAAKDSTIWGIRLN